MRRTVGVASLATLTSLVGVTCASSARAEGSRVVIVRDKSADAVVDRAEVRLAAELRAAGFQVEERVVEGDDDARKVVEEPADGGPFATVLLRRSGARAATDVWVADHVTHKTVVRRMGSRGAGDAADRALALRVVELMRASLVEGLVLPASDDDAPPAPSPAPAVAPARILPPDVTDWTRDALHEPPPRRSPHVGLALGVAGAFAGPDVGMAVAPELHVAWYATPAWSIGVLAVGPGFGARITAAEGTATVRQELALGEVAFDSAPAGVASVYVSLGAGAYHLDASGDANPPYTSGHDDTWSALLAVGAGLRVRIAGGTSVVLDAREVLALPRPVVVFASERVAAAMHPGTLGALSLAVDL